MSPPLSYVCKCTDINRPLIKLSTQRVFYGRKKACDKSSESENRGYSRTGTLSQLGISSTENTERLSGKVIHVVIQKTLEWAGCAIYTYCSNSPG